MSHTLRCSRQARQSYLAIFYYFQWQVAPKQTIRLCRGLPTNRCLSTGHDASPSASTNSILKKYKEALNFPGTRQSQEIRGLKNLPVGEEVVVHGYLGRRNDLSKKLSFATLTDRNFDSTVQIISVNQGNDGQVEGIHEKLKSVPAHSAVRIRGKLKQKKARDGSDAEEQPEMEVSLLDLTVLNEFPPEVNFVDETVFEPEQRHLQLRQSKPLRDALVFRSRVAQFCRKFITEEHGFTEIETPLLFKSTPEGAREFIVPTRRKGLVYALPQSPQQYKQILMASGISKYFQLARCFRDEDQRADRQPEFTQLDLETSFATGEDVIVIIEDLIRNLWRTFLKHDLPTPFPRMQYQEAMARFGVDKPDTRLGMEISRIEFALPVDFVSMISPLTLPSVDMLVFKPKSEDKSPEQTRQFIASFLEEKESAIFNQNPQGGPGIFIYDTMKPLSGLAPLGFEAAQQIEEEHELEDGDLVIMQARPQSEQFSGGSTMLGRLRVALHEAAVKANLLDPPTGFSPLWATDFPLLSPISPSEPGQGGTAGLASTHHPFTAPKTPEDVDLLFTNPERVIGEHYDIVMNGVELGGGSKRIHHGEMQELILRDVLKMQPERIEEFRHLIDVLKAGCPPHAGIALGFDRLIAVMLGKSSVRDVIAFPKHGRGDDPLVQSPSPIRQEELETYHLQLRD